MANKHKGSNAEREVIHLFWKTGVWTACRVAGSGSMHYPAPDIIAQRSGLVFAIECKATKASSQYLEKREVDELVQFASRAGARPVIAVRFSKKPWRFLNPSDLHDCGVHFSISEKGSELSGLTFDELIGKTA